MVNLTLRVLSRPDEAKLPTIYKELGVEYEEKVLPSIGNEILKAVVAQFNADELLTSVLRAVEAKQVAQQEAERSKYVMAKAEQERRAEIIRAEGESESAKLISYATKESGTEFIQLRKIEASGEVAATLSRSPNVAYLPKDNNLLLGLSR
ncbi:hypothetical protein AgCh_026000 [Apium graveolens]